LTLPIGLNTEERYCTTCDIGLSLT